MHRKLKDAIHKTKNPVTKTMIKEGLDNLGLHKDSFVEVHASLSSFGFVVNKAYDVVDALTETITEGVIIMPAHTPEMTNPRDWEHPPVPKSWYDIIEANRKPFDPHLFLPERVGEIARVFMLYPGVERTLHPETSLSVYNQTGDPSWLAHGFDDRKMITPLYKLQKEHGKILFVGTDFDSCTSIHLTEFMSDHATLDIYPYKIKKDGKIIEKDVITKYYDDDDKNFKAIAELYTCTYKHTPYYRQTTVGLATLTLIDAHTLFNIAKEYHRTH